MSAPRDTRATRISQKKRKRIEECFGWLKTIALLRKVRHRGTLKVDWMFTFAAAQLTTWCGMRNLMQRRARRSKSGAAVSLTRRYKRVSAYGARKITPADASKTPERSHKPDNGRHMRRFSAAC